MQYECLASKTVADLMNGVRNMAKDGWVLHQIFDDGELFYAVMEKSATDQVLTELENLLSVLIGKDN